MADYPPYTGKSVDLDDEDDDIGKVRRSKHKSSSHSARSSRSKHQHSQSKHPSRAKSTSAPVPTKPRSSRKPLPTIERLRQRLKALDLFLQMLQNDPEVFDDEDVEMVRDVKERVEHDLADAIEAARRRGATESERKQIDAVLGHMSQVLKRRQDVLETADNDLEVLRQDQDLMRFFAGKQARMQSTWQQMCAVAEERLQVFQ